MLSIGEVFVGVIGPRLYMEYTTGFDEMYNITLLEKIGSQILTILSLLRKILYYILPILSAALYRRGYFEPDFYNIWLKFCLIVVLITTFGMCLRGIGRLESAPYRRFIKALKQANCSLTAEEGKLKLMKFDFDFRWWPVDFDVRNLNQNKGRNSTTFSLSSSSNIYPLNITDILYYIGGYIFIHTLGIRILYPGSSRIILSLLRPNVIAERAILMREKNAKRFKIKTVDRNEIDAAFIDNRNKNRNGGTLIISSEGNVCYYPLGVMNTTVGRDFSVLGWNHPGFEGSTGNPFPKQEFNAINAMVQFAIYKLQFKENDIILYGWSIGGFSALCGASKYAHLKGVILDGTFDDIFQLAIVRVPRFSLKLVEAAIRYHCNLNNIDLIRQYNGPILIIRRTYDETIAHNNRIGTNRGNFLVLEMLQYRYPEIFQPQQVLFAHNLLSKTYNQLNAPKEYDNDCLTYLIKHVNAFGKFFPMNIGQDFDEDMRNQMAEFLLRKHFRDFKSSHCPLLPVEYFTIPWDIIINDLQNNQ